MGWMERRAESSATFREIVVMALMIILGVFVVVVLASRASAQTPVRLPVTRTVAPTVQFVIGQSAKIKGLIISRDGDDMLVRDEMGGTDLVTLTAQTQISSPTGLFKLEKEPRDVTSLLPGLIIEVKGEGGSRNNLVADRISFHSSALRVAQQIAAGDVDLRYGINANRDSIDALKYRVDDSLSALNHRIRDSLMAIDARFDNIDNYAVRDSVVVNFATGSARLDDEARARLTYLTTTGMKLAGFLFEVTGYADETGSMEMNQSLSDRRAQAVVNYLTQMKGVPIRRILNPTGFGEMRPVASNSTSLGRALNRRAEVRVLVNRAVDQ